MDIKSAINILEKSRGENIYSVYVPSKEKEFHFRPLTVGQQKTMSKISIDNNGLKNVEYHIMQLGELKACCVDDIDLTTLTDVDFIALMASVRLNNIISPLSLKFSCRHCKTDPIFKMKGKDKVPEDELPNFEFDVDIDFEHVVQKANEFEFKEVVFEREVKDIKFKVILKDPYIIDHLGYQNYLFTILNDNELREITDISKVKLLNYPIQFIRDIYINDEKIEGWNDLKFMDKLNFIDEYIPNTLMYDEEDSILISCINTFNDSRLKPIFQEIKCPKCGDVKEGVSTFDNFFII